MAFKTKKPAGEESGFAEIVDRFKAHPFLFGGTTVILIIVIVAFVFVPAIPNVGGGGLEQDHVFGYYNGVPIAFVPNNYFHRVLSEVASSTGFNLESDYSQNPIAAYQVWYQSFIRTLVHTVILDEMKSAGYSAPVEEIDRQVAELPQFMEDGRFSSVKYRSFDKNRLLALWRNMEEAHITRKYIDSLTDLKVSSNETAFIAAMASPERSFELVSISRSAYPDSELTSFAASNPALFKTVHLSRITLADEKAAAQVLEAVKSGRSAFEDAARNQSIPSDPLKDRGGDMGLRMAYEIYTELSEEGDRDKLLSLNRGELSPVVQVPSGWAFFRAEETPYTPDLSLADNLAKIRSYMVRFEGGRMENWLVSRVEALSAEAGENNQTLSAYINSFADPEGSIPEGSPASGFTVKNFGPVNLNYGNMGGSWEEWGMRLFPNTLDLEANPELQPAAANENFWRTAFSTPLNSPSAPFTLGDSIVVLIPTEEILPDDTSRENIAKFYSLGWMYNTIDADLNSAFLESKKFEDNFSEAFGPFISSSRF